MTEMVKRAGDAVIAALKRPFGDFSPAEMKEPWNVAAGRMVILAALDPEVIRAMIEEKIKTHYWNHHGARDPSPEFVDDLAGMLVIGLQQMAQGEL